MAFVNCLVVLHRGERGFVNQHIRAFRDGGDAYGVAGIPEKTQAPAGAVAPQHLRWGDCCAVRRHDVEPVFQPRVFLPRLKPKGDALIHVDPSRDVGLVNDVPETRHRVSQRRRSHDQAANRPAPAPADVRRLLPVHGPERQLQLSRPGPLPALFVLENRRGGCAVVRPALA